MKECTARGLIDEVRHRAETLPSGLDCVVVIGDVVESEFLIRIKRYLRANPRKERIVR